MDVLAASTYSVIGERYDNLEPHYDETTRGYAAPVSKTDSSYFLRPPPAQEIKSPTTYRSTCSLHKQAEAELESGQKVTDKYLCMCAKGKGKYYSILHWRVAVLVLSGFTWGWASSLFFILLPEYAKQRGLTSQQISYLLMTSGLSGFVFRTSFVILGKSLKLSITLSLPSY